MFYWTQNQLILGFFNSHRSANDELIPSGSIPICQTSQFDIFSFFDLEIFFFFSQLHKQKETPIKGGFSINVQPLDGI